MLMCFVRSGCKYQLFSPAAYFLCTQGGILYSFSMWKFLQEKVHPFRHHLLTISFIGGFVVDNFTLIRIDLLIDDIIITSYVILSMLGIIFMYLGASDKFSPRFKTLTDEWAAPVIQFMFGGVMSGMLVFYSRSGSWYTSWPYLVVLVGIVYGNERITKNAQRLVFNLSVFFVGLFSYLALLVPVFIGKMGDAVFIGCGILALIIMALFVRILSFIVPNFIALNTRSILFSIGMLYVALNGLYFTNLIPPVPLSIKAIGVYHNVEKLNNDTYKLSFEQGKWYEFWKESDTVFHYTEGESVYCYAAVYVPARLATTIYHRWEYYDTKLGKWVFHARIPYPIAGGRIDGYRASTHIDSVRDGKWRCSVENERGQTIGRAVFTVLTGEPVAPIVTRVDL